MFKVMNTNIIHQIDNKPKNFSQVRWVGCSVGRWSVVGRFNKVHLELEIDRLVLQTETKVITNCNRLTY